MSSKALHALHCAEELRRLERLYARKKRSTDRAVTAGRRTCWRLVQEEAALRDRMFELELEEARRIVKRLRRAGRTKQHV